jgi:predicted DNA-binding transcriptional regulator AlpA
MVQHSTILSGEASPEAIAKALGPEVIKALADLLSRQVGTAPRIRRALRLNHVLAALGVSRSTFYEGVDRGIYPAGCKVDENGRNAIWWDTEIYEIQQRAIDRRDAAAKAAA